MLRLTGSTTVLGNRPRCVGVLVLINSSPLILPGHGNTFLYLTHLIWDEGISYLRFRCLWRNWYQPTRYLPCLVRYRKCFQQMGKMNSYESSVNGFRQTFFVCLCLRILIWYWERNLSYGQRNASSAYNSESTTVTRALSPSSCSFLPCNGLPVCPLILTSMVR